MPNLWSHLKQNFHRFWEESIERWTITLDTSIDDTLRLAVIQGDERLVSRLLKSGANVKRKDSLGFTILHMAIVEGRHEMIKDLVKYGKNIEKEMFLEYRPLIHAILYSDKKEECFDALLKANIKLTTVDFMSNTLLHQMVKCIPNSVDFIDRVLGLGLDPSTVNVVGNNCLHILAYSPFCNANKMVILAAKFLQKGVDIDAQNYIRGETALQIAARRGKTNLVDFLLREGASIDLTDKYGNTGFESLISGPVSVVNVLLKHLALRNYRGEIGTEEFITIIKSDTLLQRRYQVFEEELVQLKLHPINLSYKFTYFDILCDDKYAVAKYLKNPEVRSRIRIYYFRAFNFHTEIAHKIRQANEILKAQKLAFTIVNTAFGGKLSYLCVRRISIFLAQPILANWKKHGSVQK